MSKAREEAERRVRQGEGLNYDMEVDAFVLGAEWAKADLPSREEVRATVREYLIGADGDADSRTIGDAIWALLQGGE